jgi:Flp pilus assembly protein TadG
MRRALIAWLRDERGASAVEFALVLGPFLLLIFGIIHLCLMMYSAQQLNFAAEATARCMVTAQASGYLSAPCYYDTTATPPDTSAVQTYFKAMYHGPTATPTFTTLDEKQTCNSSSDYQVVASANYVINAAFFTKTVPLTAKACFPHA